MSTIMGIYKIVKKLGRGGFGDVYLVTDQKDKFFAIKEINKKNVDSNESQYVYNQIQVMKELDSQYIVKFYNSYETSQYMYIVLEYCNGGDLRRDMGNQPDKVYSLKDTARILSDVIKGLQVVHAKSFFHRDIKIDNILVNTDQKGKKVRVNKMQVYKIADFGLSKAKDKGQTILGTGNYMSPEIYGGLEYGFEVDMWAFGVVMFFMLNKQFPFSISVLIIEISPHLMDNSSMQCTQLTKQAKDFSYSKQVSKTKQNLQINCTKQMEDLFKRIFQIDNKKRITFLQIRSYQIFKPYFSEDINQRAKIIYRCHNVKVAKKPTLTIVNNPECQNVIFRHTVDPDISISQKFPKQREYLQHKNDQIEFLYLNFKEFKEVSGFLTVIQKMPLCYNLIKYYIVLKKHYLQQISTQKICPQYPNLALKGYFKTVSFKKQFKQFQQQLDAAIIEFQTLHGQCANSLNMIEKINSKFSDAFDDRIDDVKFVNPFKTSYRLSTRYVFDKLKKFINDSIVALVVISHVFNRIFLQKPRMQKAFKKYLQQQHTTIYNINYNKLREWMSKANGNELNSITCGIVNNYFNSSH